MAPTPAFWKGYLKLSLVSCPIALYTGTSATERVSFRQINKKTGNRLRQQLVDEVTRESVEGDDKGRGYEYAKNAYFPVDDDELDALAVESKIPSTKLFELIAVARNPLPRAGRRHHRHRHAPRARE